MTKYMSFKDLRDAVANARNKKEEAALLSQWRARFPEQYRNRFGA